MVQYESFKFLTSQLSMVEHELAKAILDNRDVVPVVFRIKGNGNRYQERELGRCVRHKVPEEWTCRRALHPASRIFFFLRGKDSLVGRLGRS